MAHVFQSGAFLQQCFSVHPLSLAVRMFTPPGAIGIACAHCKSKHRLTADTITHNAGDADMREEGAATGLASCVARHRDALHVTDVCVDRSFVRFRCRECRAGFQAKVSLFETRQP